MSEDPAGYRAFSPYGVTCHLGGKTMQRWYCKGFLRQLAENTLCRHSF
uniref:Uncharacterized protein n=1 Tax=Anguilla anguilla TaxID=7936 RepID=A0A0E9S208_ANGAN